MAHHALLRQPRGHGGGLSAGQGGGAEASADVETHFRVTIPSGESTFTVLVPHHYLQDSRRRFYFNHLHLMPEFYSLEAEKLNLDSDPTLDRVFERDLHVKIDYPDPKAVYGSGGYENGTSVTKTVDLLKKLNAHFESKKPAFAYTSHLFIDWIDETVHADQEIGDYVPTLADIYYSESYNETKHFNALPISVQELEGVNNYRPPVDGSMPDTLDYLDRIRLRLWLAPYTRAVFSNVQVFVEDLGFPLEQMGEMHYRQFNILNDRPYWRVMAQGDSAPKGTLSMTNVKVRVVPSDATIESRIKGLNMTQRDWLDDAKLTNSLAQAVKQSSRAANTRFSVAFDASTKKYQFEFPSSEAVSVQIICEPDFAHRLGFGYQRLIVRGMQAEAQEERHSAEDPQKRAAAVVYDTGPIVCTLDQESSNTTCGSLYQTMAALYPHFSGTLSMPGAVCQCSLASAASSGTAVQLSANRFGSGSADKVPIRFRLLRIYDHRSISDFSWSCNGCIYGVLRGTCLV